MIDCRTLMAGLGVSAGAMLAPPMAAGAATTPEPGAWIDLWLNDAPDAPDLLPAEQIVERSSNPLAPDRIMQNIARPRMALFRPDKPTGAAVLIAPGGGYRHVVIDKEGFEMARWLTARGITVAVLFYRLPHQGWATGPDTPLADAQRAMRLLRHQHAALGIDPQRISIMGFSAGGHVAATLATRFAVPACPPVDSADALPARPDTAALIYPVISMRAEITHPGSRERLLGTAPPAALELAHSPDANVLENAPPCFILHAEDDDVVPAQNALGMRTALKAKGIPVETHVYEQGGHGFGISRAAGKPVATWPEVWLAWARASGVA